MKVKVRFRGRVIDFRTHFSASVFLDTLNTDAKRSFTTSGIIALSDSENLADTLAFFLPQRIEPSDIVDFVVANQLSDRNSLAVVADISAQSEDLISNFTVEPNPFTPNDDGINDAMNVIFDVQRLLVPKAVHLEIYDLDGKRVHRTERQLASGGYSQQWDGRNDAGQRVPPGLYILRIYTEADEAGASPMRLISVAY